MLRLDDLHGYWTIEFLVDRGEESGHAAGGEALRQPIAGVDAEGEDLWRLQLCAVDDAAIDVLIEATPASGADLQDVDAAIEQLLLARDHAGARRREIVAQPAHLQRGSKLTRETLEQQSLTI